MGRLSKMLMGWKRSTQSQTGESSTYDTAFGYLHIVSLTMNDCWCIGVVIFAVNNHMGVLNSLGFPFLCLEVFKFVARVEN